MKNAKGIEHRGPTKTYIWDRDADELSSEDVREEPTSMDVLGNNVACNINQAHCENCGSTDAQDLAGDQGYTDCCNELVSYDARGCRDHHGENTRSQDTGPNEYTAGYKDGFRDAAARSRAIGASSETLEK